MRGVIYARYSEGPRQTDQSIEGQVADCRAYAAEHGIDIIGIYADRHISGTSTEGRDDFLRMIHDAERRLFDCVIVWKVDRFGRSREDIAVNKIRLRKAGVQLMYAKEAVPDGPEGILLESLLEGLAEYYSADLRQKVTRGIRETAKKGMSPFGMLPIGYKTDADRRIVVDPVAADAVREVFRMHLAGSPILEIRKMLFSRGVTNNGKMYGKGTIYRILRNEHYLGRFVVQGVELQAEPIIDKKTFDAAAAGFRGPYHNAAGRADVDYLLSCKCHCAACGKMLQGTHGTGKAGRKYYYYKCPTKGCSLKPVPKDELEALVLQNTIADVLTDEMVEKLTRRIMEVQRAERAGDPAEALKSQLKAAKKKQDNLITAIENGARTSLVARLNEIDAQIEALQLEIDRAELKRPIVPEALVRGWLLSFRDGDVTDPAFRRKLVSAFVADVVVGQDLVTVYYNTTQKEPSACSRTAQAPQAPDPYSNTPAVLPDYIIFAFPRNKKRPHNGAPKKEDLLVDVPHEKRAGAVSDAAGALQRSVFHTII